MTKPRRPSIEAPVASSACADDPPTTHYAPFELDGLLREEVTTTVRADTRTPLLEATLLDVSVQPVCPPAVEHEHLPEPARAASSAVPPLGRTSKAASRRTLVFERLAYGAGVLCALLFAGWLVLQRSAASVTTDRPLPAPAPTAQARGLEPTALIEVASSIAATPSPPVPAPAPAQTPAPETKAKARAAGSPSARTAVHLLLANDYAGAASAYAALAESLPREPVYAVLARTLQQLASRRCDDSALPCPSRRSTP